MGKIKKNPLIFAEHKTSKASALSLELPDNSIFIEGEGDWIESRLPFKIFSTLPPA